MKNVRTLRGVLRVMMVCILLVCTSGVFGQVRYVDDDAPASGDGLAWGTAYRFLQDALAEAAASGGAITEIRVGQGTYKPDRDELNPTGTGDRSTAFDIVKGTSLYGGYGGIEAVDPNDRNVVLYLTVFSGDLAGDDLAGFINVGENSYHVVTADATTFETTIDGVTMRDGEAQGGCCGQNRGGGLYVTNGEVTISQCDFLDNRSSIFGAGVAVWDFSDSTFIDCRFEGNDCTGGEGGGLYSGGLSNPGGELSLINCVFDSNSAEYGAGIMAAPSLAILDNCNFTGNTAVWDGGGAWIRITNTGSLTISQSDYFDNLTIADSGSGLYIRGTGTVDITDVQFHGNIAQTTGGAIRFDDNTQTVTISNCEFVSNEAVVNIGGAINSRIADIDIDNCLFESNTGGAIGFEQGDLTIKFSDFIDNSSGGSGGAVRVAIGFFDDVAFMNCRFLGNHANGRGGALNLSFNPATLTNLIFSGNTAGQRGGAIYADETELHMVNCTLAGNSSGQHGGGVAIVDAFGMTHEIHNCIFWDNTDTDGLSETSQIWSLPGITLDVRNSCVHGLSAVFAGLNNIGVDPAFVNPLGADLIRGTTDDDLYLLACSQAVDAGDNGLLPLDLLDLDDDLDVAEILPIDLAADLRVRDAAVDMGAFEMLDTDGDGVPDGSLSILVDCNNNLIPDPCEVADGTSSDCNYNRIPDECEADCNGNSIPDDCDLLEFDLNTGVITPFGEGLLEKRVEIRAPLAIGDVVIDWEMRGDIDAENEIITVMLNGVILGEAFEELGTYLECDSLAAYDQIIIPESTYNGILASHPTRNAIFEIQASNYVEAGLCEPDSYVVMVVHYDAGVSRDLNVNGVPDECDPTCPADSNVDFKVDVLDLLEFLATWGLCPAPCAADSNNDGQVDVLDLVALLAAWGPCP